MRKKVYIYKKVILKKSEKKKKKLCGFAIFNGCNRLLGEIGNATQVTHTFHNPTAGSNQTKAGCNIS